LPVAETRRGFFLGAAAYAMWGLFPLYWPLLKPAGAVEILAHRVFWSLVVMLLLVLVLGRSRHVVETSLGYFINPLVTVLMGVVILGERLRRLQWIALGIAAVAVVGLTVEYGRPPWVALALAFSFGSYGLAKKKANVGAVESLTVETMVLVPVAAGYILWLMDQGTSTFGTDGLGHALLLTTTGIVTAVPLICFGAAATRVTLTTIGLLQYLAPTIQFALGVLLFREDMPPMRWIGFMLVWVALVIFTYEAIRNRRRQLRLTTQASAL
jgi:chloramphenicol-sensitive protein RarD